MVLYPIAAFIDYERIRAYYRIIHPGESMGPDMGFGPPFAWIQAAAQSAFAFVVALMIGALFFKKSSANKSAPPNAGCAEAPLSLQRER